MLRLAKISAINCKRLVCILCKKDLCCSNLREGGSGEVCADLFSYAELVCGSVHVRILTEYNKEKKSWWT